MATVMQIGPLLSGVIDPNTGEAAAGGTVYFYEPGTTTPMNVWTEAAKSNAFTEYDLNDAGAAELWGDGIYDVVIKDSDGTTLYTWDDMVFQRYDFQTKAITGNYTQEAAYNAIYLASSGVSGDATLTLLAYASWPEFPVYIFNYNTTYDIIITPPTGTINGAASYTLSSWGDATTGVIVFCDAAGVYHVTAGSQEQLVAQDGSGRAVAMTEDGLVDSDTDFASGYALLGNSTESARLISVMCRVQYSSGTTLKVTLQEASTYGYNQPTQVVADGITNGGTVSGVYISASVLRFDESILSPESDSCEVVGVLGAFIIGPYQVTGGTVPTVWGSVGSSYIQIMLSVDGSSTTWHTGLGTSSDSLYFQLLYLVKLVS